MFKFLVLLFIIKLYARRSNDFFQQFSQIRTFIFDKVLKDGSFQTKAQLVGSVNTEIQ